MSDLIITKEHGLTNFPDFHVNFLDIWKIVFSAETLEIHYRDHSERLIFNTIKDCVAVESMFFYHPKRIAYLPKSPRLKLFEYLNKINFKKFIKK